MLKPRDLTYMQLGAIITALQESFYLDVDPQGNAIWDPNSEVDAAGLVDTMGTMLREHGLCPESIFPAGDCIDLDRLIKVWDRGNRRIVVSLLSERPRSATAAFVSRLTAAGGDVDMLIALFANREALPL